MSREVNIKLPSFPLFGVLAVVLTVLNLTGHIDISWWWIVATFFAPIIIIVGFLLAIGILTVVTMGSVYLIGGIAAFFDEWKYKRRRTKIGAIKKSHTSHR